MNDQELNENNENEALEAEQQQSAEQQEAEQQQKNVQALQDTANAIKDGASLGKNIATGNVLGAAKDAVNLAKNKKARQAVITSAIMNMIMPFIVILIFASIVLGILGIFGSVGDAVLDVISNIIEFFTVDENGAITISDEQIDTIINSISELGVSAEDLKLLGDYDDSASEQEKQEAMRKYIRKFYEAQVVTETLNYNKGGGVFDNNTYGTVYVYRLDDEETTDIIDSDKERVQLTYIPYEEMQEYASKTDARSAEEVRQYFSIDETGNLVYASTTRVIVEKGDSINSLREESDTTTVVLRAINYKSAVSQYTTKMNFLLYLTMVSQNPEFVSAVTDLIKDSRIEITLLDNVSTNVNIETYNYTLHTRVGNESENSYTGETITTYSESEENRTEVTRTTTVIYNPTAKITYAKTWFLEQEIIFNRVEKEPVEENYTYDASNDATLEDGEPLTGSQTGSWRTGQVKTYQETTNESVYEEGIRGDVDFSRLGQKGDSERYANGQIEEPTFIGLMETRFDIPYSTRTEEAGSNLVSGAEILFYLLQKDADLETMETIMRYALYLYSGRDYGVTELDGTYFEIGEFVTITLSSETDLLINYIRHFENAGGAPTNSDGTKYIIETDGAGHLTVGYGIDIYNGGFADIFLAAGYTLEVGAEVDVDFVDALEKQEIESNISSVKSITSGLDLKDYQIHALVSRAYNCGVSGALTYKRGSPAMNFVDSYNAYWSEEDDQFEEKNSNADFSHSLYTQYMSKPTTSDGQYMAGLETRRESEWTLFQTGYYDVLGEWYSSAVLSGGTVYYQNDYADVSYGNNNLARSGCGPTCFAMVASDYTGTSITPRDAVAWCGNTYYVSGAGTSWAYFSAAANYFNLPCTVVNLGNDIDAAVEELQKGNLVISSQSAGLFTSGGHFILLSSIDENGGIKVRDPNKNNAVNKGYNDRVFSASEIQRSSKNYWSFQR